MCAVIFRLEKDISKIPINWKAGLDITKDLKTGETNIETIQMNSLPGEAMQGGPKCKINGKTVPCFVGASPNSSITSTLLAKMLESFDTIGVFDRSDGVLPFLLLDGHQSRVQLPFLKYINDEAHRWIVCLGVPYCTHLWQVSDSIELNGCFKMALTMAKREYLRHKPTGKKTFSPTDVIPLINHSWDKSFNRHQYALKAICKRGWSPLNYELLDHPTVQTFYDNSKNNPESSTSTGNNDAVHRSSTSTNVDLSTINFSEDSSAGRMFDALIRYKMKNEGRKAKYEKQLIKGNDKEIHMRKLCELTRISSGELTAANHFLRDENVLLLLQEKTFVYEEKKEQISKRNRKERTMHKQNTLQSSKKTSTTTITYLRSKSFNSTI